MIKKLKPKGLNGLLSLLAGLLFLGLIPVYIAIFKSTYNTALLMFFIFFVVVGILLCSEFFGNKIIITETSVIIYQFYKEKYFITLSEVTDARLGLFCKAWWNFGDKNVMSAKVFTKDYTIEFPVSCYSEKQHQELLNALTNK